MDTTIAPASLSMPNITYPALVHGPHRTSETSVYVQSGPSLAYNSRTMAPNSLEDMRLPWAAFQHQGTQRQWSDNEARTESTMTHQPKTAKPFRSINSGEEVTIIPRKKIDPMSSYEANRTPQSEPIECPEAKPILPLGCNDWQEIESIISIGYHVSVSAKHYVLEAKIRMYLAVKQQDLLLIDVVSIQKGPEAVFHYLGITQPPVLDGPPELKQIKLLAILDCELDKLKPLVDT